MKTIYILVILLSVLPRTIFSQINNFNCDSLRTIVSQDSNGVKITPFDQDYFYLKTSFYFKKVCNKTMFNKNKVIFHFEFDIDSTGVISHEVFKGHSQSPMTYVKHRIMVNYWETIFRLANWQLRGAKQILLCNHRKYAKGILRIFFYENDRCIITFANNLANEEEMDDFILFGKD
jgi:hypothetical protein